MGRQDGTEHHGPDTPVHVPAQKTNPFYEEWWFLVVIALVGLIFILLLVFVLIIRGQSKKYAKKTDSGELAPKPCWLDGTFLGLPPFWRGWSWGVSLSWKCTWSGRWGSLGFLHTISISYFGFNSNKRKRPSQVGEGRPPGPTGWGE